ncbi:MAG: hypothetical protein ACOX52_18680 [Verrucomicrobiota bacterium]
MGSGRPSEKLDGEGSSGAESIPTPTPIQTLIGLIGLIGHPFLEVAPEGTYLFGRPPAALEQY